MEWMGINLTTYAMSSIQSHNLWNEQYSITQLMERVVINHTTY
jgi:hypothetical protein